MQPLPRKFLRACAYLLAAAIALAILFSVFGYRMLVVKSSPHGHGDAAIVLQGSILGEKARLAGAMDLLKQGSVDRVLLSVPRESYWGQAIPPVARAYLERVYGGDLAARVDFCELGSDVDSTRQEMEALRPCIEDHHWRSLVVVTSDYHTRRAGIIWRKLPKQNSTVTVWVEGVPDPEFQQPWWKHRRSAKVFLLESTKLVWTALGG